MSGFHLGGGGGGLNRAPKNWGFGKRAQLTGALISYYELWPKAPKIFSSIKICFFFFTKYMANDDFSEPPRRADSKNPIFIFCPFLGLGHLRGPGFSLGRISGVL